MLLALCEAFPQLDRQPSAGSSFDVVRFICNVNARWRTHLTYESNVGETGFGTGPGSNLLPPN